MATTLGATAAAAATGSVGVGLFSYNRGNYMMDQKLHYSRFTAGLNMAIAQTGMYREDIAHLTGLTVTRQDAYHGIAAMGITILTAIYCPGRVGLHTPPPPGWLMGLAFLNIAGAYLFLSLTIWLSMHASMRADTAATHMLTRFVRLPIPSQVQLDKARKFLSSYEEQPPGEIFRVPFTRHQRPGKKKQGGYNEELDIDDDAKKRARWGYDVPAWYRKEKAIDNHGTIETMMPLDCKGEAPEHFEVYRELQMEWFPYDVYARLSIFLAFMHLVQGWTFMQIGHQMTENRALFACAIVILPMFVLEQCVLTLDIIPNMFPSLHRLGPCALWAAYLADIVEYKRWFDPGTQAFGIVLVYCAYVLQIVYTVSLLYLCKPSDSPPEVAESPGASWWPSAWRLPEAFQHAIWLVAPPKTLDPGLTDLAGELRAAQVGGGFGGGLRAEKVKDEQKQRRDVHQALGKQSESPAWMFVKFGLIAMIVAWGWLTFGFTIEVSNQGTSHPSLLSAPGLPNNARDPRYRPPKPGTEEPVEVGTGGVVAGPAVNMDEGAIGHGAERRLAGLDVPSLAAAMGAPSSADRLDFADKVRAILPHLEGLVIGPAASRPLPPVAPMLPPAAAAAALGGGWGAGPTLALVRWPRLFQPSLLACGPRSDGLHWVIALSRHGRGAAVFVPAAGEAPHPAIEAAPFVLEGIIDHGPLVSAAWDPAGLLVMTSQGKVLDCPGSADPASGSWRCGLAPGRVPLPVDDLGLAAAPAAGQVALARGPAGLRAAVLLPEQETVALFLHEDSVWQPVGEVRTQAPASVVSFAQAGEALLLVAADGMVHRLSARDGSTTTQAPAPSTEELGHGGPHAWPAVCGLPDGGHLRLGLGPQEPKLLLG